MVAGLIKKKIISSLQMLTHLLHPALPSHVFEHVKLQSRLVYMDRLRCNPPPNLFYICLRLLLSSTQLPIFAVAICPIPCGPG